MNQSKEELWNVFKQWALEGWRSGMTSPDEIGSRLSFLFSIRCFPSFDNPTNWQIYSRSKSSQEIEYFGCRREWDLNKDLASFEKTENLTRYKYRGYIKPTFYDTILRLQLESIQPLLDVICSSSLLLQISSSSIGCDGTSYQLVLGNSWAGITFNWWETGPPAWQDIVTSCIDTFNSLERVHFL